tara:strand:- start:51 stop:1460 length:1410 start_codon:yes stop_codon:yes gene_type:complete
MLHKGPCEISMVHVGSIYARLERDDDAIPGNIVRRDFQESWRYLHEHLGQRFLKLLGGEKAARASEADVAHLKEISCLYGSAVDGKLATGYDVVRGGDGHDLLLKHEKWQREISHEVHAQDLAALIANDSKAPHRLLSVLLGAQGKGSADPFTSVPVSPGASGLTWSSGAFRNHICYRLQIPNKEFHIPPADFMGTPPTCPLTSKASGKTCGHPADDAHARLCRYVINFKNELHDSQMKSFWVPLLRSLLGGVQYEPRNVLVRTEREKRDGTSSLRRPGDASHHAHISMKWRGMDLGLTDSSTGQTIGVNRDGRPLASRKPGVHVARMEKNKLKNLTNLPICSDGTKAVDVITPVIFALTGSVGKSATDYFKALSAVAHPGDREDPAVRQARSLWISHQRKIHSSLLAHAFYDLALRKTELINAVLRDARNLGGPAIGAPLSYGVDAQLDLGEGLRFFEDGDVGGAGGG